MADKSKDSLTANHHSYLDGICAELQCSKNPVGWCGYCFAHCGVKGIVKEFMKALGRL